MPTAFEKLDPAWAWSRYRSDEEQPWNNARAAHLFRRAGFGATWPQIEEAAGRDSAEVIDELLHAGEQAEAFNAESDELADNVLAGGDVEGLPAWWLYRMCRTPDPLLEKLTLFWHGHFAASAAKVTDARLMLAQNRLFRAHARGKFGPLVRQVSRDPAMLLYLDSDTNRKTHPNENYARELMELFCLGPGNYTEKDIQELARSFTGWDVVRGRFRFNRYEHDSGMKTILGRRGKFGGDEGVDIVLAQESAPRFIARKLFRFFICDEPEPSPQLLEPLAAGLRNSDFDIGNTVEMLIRSRIFFSQHAMGRKIRSPIEMGIGLLRSLELAANFHQLAERLADLGQAPFYPPNVKGWDGGRVWINSSTLLGRANLVRRLVAGQEQVAQAADRAGAKSPEEIVTWASDLLLAVPPPEPARQTLINLATDSDPSQRAIKVIVALGAMPEFQLV